MVVITAQNGHWNNHEKVKSGEGKVRNKYLKVVNDCEILRIILKSL